MAKLIIRDFHSDRAAIDAEEEFNRIFHLGLVPDSIEEKQLELRPERVRLSKLIAQLGLASSVAEANRLIEQEAVSLNDQKVSNVKADLDLAQPGTFISESGQAAFSEAGRGQGFLKNQPREAEVIVDRGSAQMAKPDLLLKNDDQACYSKMASCPSVRCFH